MQWTELDGNEESSRQRGVCYPASAKGELVITDMTEWTILKRSLSFVFCA